jgi:DNA-binding transcriptional LysR family regulator
MSYRLPPPNGLRTFEAAAGHLGFKHSASGLGVTPGAESQQVRALEQTLGVALFRRLPRNLLLTKEGETRQAHRLRFRTEARGRPLVHLSRICRECAAA